MIMTPGDLISPAMVWPSCDQRIMSSQVPSEALRDSCDGKSMRSTCSHPLHKLTRRLLPAHDSVSHNLPRSLLADPTLLSSLRCGSRNPEMQSHNCHYIPAIPLFCRTRTTTRRFSACPFSVLSSLIWCASPMAPGASILVRGMCPC